MAYRLLKEGEVILDTDRFFDETISEWVKPNCIGQPAPSPDYTSHRVYRREIKPKEGE